jgi:hypothetical protein
MTRRLRSLAVAGLTLILSLTALHGQDRPHYRSFILGSGLSSVSAQIKGSAADATVVHNRPALIQHLLWRQPYFVASSNETQTDPVEQIAFSFYNDQLFRLVIAYDRQRTKGMTDADMIRALSDAYTVVLFRASFGEGFQVVVTSTSLDALARTADAEAVRLDQREAPQRAMAQEKKAAEDARLSLEETRATNNAAFRP